MTSALTTRGDLVFDGPIYRPADDGYDTGRVAFDPNLDAHPLAVAEATSAADISAAIAWSRAHDVPFAVQSTGHGTHVGCDGGLLLKTSRLGTVLVDPDRRIARVGAGARWSDVLAAAAPFGLAPLSGSSPEVGVAGYTLGGGLSWLSRRYGFAADSLLRAELVTADGRLVTASPRMNPELLWALRGGGGNFGVVTSLDIRLHKVDSIFVGTAVFPFTTVTDTLDRYRSWTQNIPDALSTAIVLLPNWPEHNGPVFAIRCMYSGEAAAAIKVLGPLYREAGRAIWEDFGQTTFAHARIPGTAPRNVELFESLPDEVIDASIDAIDDYPVNAIEIRQWGGAMAQSGAPIAARDAAYSIIVDGPAEAMDEIRPYATGDQFLNFLADPARVADAYGPADLPRLRQIKHRWDPYNVFSVNHNIRPARVGYDISSTGGELTPPTGVGARPVTRPAR